MNEGVILLVEDDPSIAELAKLQLEQAEFTNEVVVARDGVEAVDYLLGGGREANLMPCLVLLDLHMPRMGGLEVLRRMRSDERTRFVPVVMLSSSDDPKDVRGAYEEGANAYLEKMPGRVPWPEQVLTLVAQPNLKLFRKYGNLWAEVLYWPTILLAMVVITFLTFR